MVRKLESSEQQWPSGTIIWVVKSCWGIIEHQVPDLICIQWNCEDVHSKRFCSTQFVPEGGGDDFINEHAEVGQWLLPSNDVGVDIRKIGRVRVSNWSKNCFTTRGTKLASWSTDDEWFCGVGIRSLRARKERLKKGRNHQNSVSLYSVPSCRRSGKFAC